MRYLVQEHDLEDLCKTIADMIVKSSKKAIKKRNKFTLVLSGGSTPEKLYSLLATSHFSNQLDWKKIFIFWGDERYVPAKDPNNNSLMARNALLNKVPLPEENIFPIPVHVKPLAAAKKYEKTIRTFFKRSKPKFDVILLGLGENGHTASIFPGSPIIKEKKKLVAAEYIEEVDMYRITFTLPLLLSARKNIFMISGESKSDMLNTVLFGEFKPDKIPAQLIHKKNNDIYFCFDDAAGSKVSQSLADIS